MKSRSNSPPTPDSCWPDERQTLLLKAAIMDEADARTCFEEWIQRVDIDRLEYASMRMVPLLHSNLARIGVRHPEMNRLRGIARYHWMQNQMVLRTVPDVLTVLHNEGIRTLLLKGAALIERYYLDASLRPMNDVDVLVPYDDALAAVDALVAAGWKPMFVSDVDTLRESPDRRVRNGICFLNAQNRECDLHWSVLHDSTWRGAEDVFWAEAEALDYRGIPTFTLSPTHQLLHTCVHGGRYNEFHPMRWIGDAAFIIRNDGERIDWDACIELAYQHHMVLVLKEAFNLLVGEYGIAVPERVLRDVNRRKASRVELARYRLITEKPEGLAGLVRRDWYQHCVLSPRDSTLRHAVTFPRYLKELWRIESWWCLPGYAFRRLLHRTGIRPDNAARTRGGH